MSIADSGPGTLRNALGASEGGDTITFGVTGTIRLESGLEIESDVTVEGPPHAGTDPFVRLDGGGVAVARHTGGLSPSSPA